MGAEGDVHCLDLMSDEIRFRSLAGGAVTMEFTRKDEVKRFFAALTSQWRMKRNVIDEFIA
jgi:hypothetical protein